jgi:menaquinone-dependent protoporphyrinogen oxidase
LKIGLEIKGKICYTVSVFLYILFIFDIFGGAAVKTAIVYYSKTGAAAECARELYKIIPDAKLFNLAVDSCDVSSFDNVILGGGIRAGMIPKQLKKFVSENELTIQKKNVGIFVCCADYRQNLSYIEQNFPAIIVKKAVAADGFGARMNPDEMKGFDKFVAKIAMKKIIKAGGSAPSIDKSKISLFAKKFI